MTITIEQADWRKQQQDLMRIRHAVFVREQGVPVELERDRHDDTALHLLAISAEGDPVATARMLTDGHIGHIGHIGRMAVLAAWRGRGIGTAMLRELIRIAGERGLGDLVLNAQCEAESFYDRLGFVAEGMVFKDAGIDHRRMRMHLDRDDG